MKATIDLLGNKEKTKVSLALSKESVMLLDKAVIGFRSMFLLLTKEGDIQKEFNKKNALLFKNSLSRSEMVEQTITGIADENVFLVDDKLMSLNGFADFVDQLSIDMSIIKRIDLDNFLSVDLDDSNPSEYQENFLTFANITESGKDISERDASSKYKSFFNSIKFVLRSDVDRIIDPDDFEPDFSSITFDEIKENYEKLASTTLDFTYIRMERIKEVIRECIQMESESFKFKFQLFKYLKFSTYDDEFEFSDYHFIQRYYQQKFSRKGKSQYETDHIED